MCSSPDKYSQLANNYIYLRRSRKNDLRIRHRLPISIRQMSPLCITSQVISVINVDHFSHQYDTEIQNSVCVCVCVCTADSKKVILYICIYTYIYIFLSSTLDYKT